MPRDLIEIVLKLGSPRVLVVGDLILDRYVWGDVDRISPEAPIQILKAKREEVRPGGAGNVAANLAALGARVTCIGATGNDENGFLLTESLKAMGIDVSQVVRDSSRPTTEKSRMVAQSQQILRVDRETDAPINQSLERLICEASEACVSEADIVLVSDYGKGTLTEEVLRTIIDHACQRSRKVLAGPKGRDFRKYRGASIITPNLAEAELASGMEGRSEEAIRTMAENFLSKLDLEAVVITRGSGGMSVYEKGASPLHVPARTRVLYDITGAGDTVLATLGLVVGSGYSIAQAANLATVAAGVACGKLGTATVSREEILHELVELHPSVFGKVIDISHLEKVLDKYRKEGKRIVFTNGCFDILHVGHLSLLRSARSFGDVLVVGLNSDASAKAIKGPSRPLVPQNERAQILAALEFVDYVAIFDEPTPLEIIERVRPDVLVKGEDWRQKGVVGREFVESRGGRVELVSLMPGISTTDLMHRLSRAGVENES